MSRRTLLWALVVTGVVACIRAPDHAEFAIGMTRAEVIDRFGEPERKQVIRKAAEPIWGAIETFWSEVPLGSEVEIWSYSTRIRDTNDGGSPSSDGVTELYFVDGSGTVNGIGFAPRGVVFEADS